MPGESRLYHDLVDLWPLVSGPEHYGEEFATFRTRFERHGLGPGARILHLGSGGGSVDFHLKSLYDVTGVDVSADMIAHARTVNPEVTYIEGDIRDVRLGRTFDAVLVHDAIAYMTSIEELEAVYRTAAAHLEIGGLMIALPEELRSRAGRLPPSIELHEDGDRQVAIVHTAHDEDPADHRIETTFVFVIREGDRMRIEVDRHVNGVFTLDEFLDAMRVAGFDPRAEPWELSDWGDTPPMPLVTAVRIN
jgi:SAM-dependent methyltransferase